MGTTVELPGYRVVARDPGRRGHPPRRRRRLPRLAPRGPLGLPFRVTGRHEYAASTADRSGGGPRGRRPTTPTAARSLGRAVRAGGLSRDGDVASATSCSTAVLEARRPHPARPAPPAAASSRPAPAPGPTVAVAGSPTARSAPRRRAARPLRRRSGRGRSCARAGSGDGAARRHRLLRGLVAASLEGAPVPAEPRPPPVPSPRYVHRDARPTAPSRSWRASPSRRCSWPRRRSTRSPWCACRTSTRAARRADAGRRPRRARRRVAAIARTGSSWSPHPTLVRSSALATGVRLRGRRRPTPALARGRRGLCAGLRGGEPPGRPSTATPRPIPSATCAASSRGSTASAARAGARPTPSSATRSTWRRRSPTTCRACGSRSGVNLLRCRLGGGLEIWGAHTLDPGRRPVPRPPPAGAPDRARRPPGRSSRSSSTPNTQLLWFAVRRAVSGILMEAFRSGALAAATPEEAYRVRCDETTNPPDTSTTGQVVCEIEVAPATPMEFIRCG